MSLQGGPKIIKNGLVLYLDPGSNISYIGTGTSLLDILGNNNSTLPTGQFSFQDDKSILFDNVNSSPTSNTYSADLDSLTNLPNWTISNWYIRPIQTTPYTEFNSNLIGDSSSDSIVYFATNVFSGIDTMIEDSDGNLFVAGQNEKFQEIARYGMVKIDTSGNIVQEFDLGLVPSGSRSIEGLIIDSTGNGYYGGTNNGVITQFNITTGERGRTATGFNTTISVGQYILDEANDKIYIRGLFTTVQGYDRRGLVKLNFSDFTIDPSLDTSNGFNTAPRKITVDPLGNIYAVGSFTSYKGNSYGYIIKLDSTGAVDTSFNTGTGFNNAQVNGLYYQPSTGKLIVAGAFNLYNGTSVNRIVRLNTDGTIDSTFNSGGTGFNNTVLDLSVQSDGKIILVGLFTSYNESSSNFIVRLNADGTLDGTFNIGSGFSVAMSNCYVLSNDKIIVGRGQVGFQTTFNGTNTFWDGLCRLNSDGSFDTTFDVGYGFTSATYRSQFQFRYKNSVGSNVTLNDFGAYPSFGGRREISLFEEFYTGWQFLTITKDSNNVLRHYEKGILVKEYSSFNPTDDLSLRVSSLANGRLGNISVYNRALSDDEVFDLYLSLKERFL